MERITLSVLPDTAVAPTRAEQRAPSEPESVEKRAQRELESAKAELAVEFEHRLAGERARCADEVRQLESQLKQRLELVASDVQVLANAAERAIADFYRESEPLLIEIACSVAAAVLDREPTDEEAKVISRSLSWAMEHLSGEGRLDIHVNASLLARLGESGLLPDSDVPSLVRWHRTDELGPADYVVTSPGATIRRVAGEAFERASRVVRGVQDESDLPETTKNDDGGHNV